MYSQTTLMAAFGLGVGLTMGVRPEGRRLKQAAACAGYIRRNVDLGTLRKFSGTLGQIRRQSIPAANSSRTAA